jgi:hypothetical protein
VVFGLALAAPISCLADDVAGCYELRLSKWSPVISLGEDEKFITPPKRIALTTTIDNTWGDEHTFRVTPTNGAAPSVHRAAYWRSDARGVHITWTNGFSGLTMDLEVRGSDLVGIAHTVWDFSRPGQTSQVVAIRISCERLGR